MAYNRIEPIGEFRADLRAAFMTFNIIRALVTSECANKIKVSDFMLDFSGDRTESHEQTDEEQAAILSVMAMAMRPPVIEDGSV